MERGAWEQGAAGLIGRNRELSTLRARWVAAGRGELQVVRVVGEPGMGKSALLGAVVQATGDEGAAAVRLRGTPGQERYAAVARLVRRLVDPSELRGLQAALGLDAGAVLTLVPELEGTRPSAGPALPDPDRVADGLRRLLAWRAAQGPLVVAVDDAVDLDPGSRAVLRDLAADRPQVPALLLLAEREEEGDEPVLGSSLWVTTILLDGLDAAAVAEVVRLETGYDPAPVTVRELLAATGGNPGFVVEAVRAADPARLAAGTHPIVSRGAEELARRRLDSLVALPEVGRIDPLLRAAATLGDEIEPELVTTVTGADPARLAHVLGRAGVVRAVERRGPGPWRFTPGVRSRLLADLPPIEAAGYHRRAAAALRARPAVSAEAVAHHLVAAMALARAPEPEAVAWVCRAADDAAAAGRLGALARLLRRALDVLPAGDPADRAIVGARLAAALWEAEGARQSRLAWVEAAAAARAAIGEGGTGAVPAVDLLVDAAVGYARTFDPVTPPDEASRSLLEDAITASSGPGALATAEAALSLLSASADPRRAALAASALAHATAAGDPRGVALAALARHGVLWQPDQGEARTQAAADALGAAEAAGDLALALEARRARHADLLVVGDRAGADQEFAALLRAADGYEHAGVAWHLPALHAARAVLEGRDDRATQWIDRARAAAAGSDPVPAAAVALALRLTQDTDDAGWLEVLAGIDDLLDRRPESSVWHAARARTLVALHRADEARPAVTRFLVDQPGRLPAGAEWLPTLALLCRAVVGTGDRDHAARLGHLLEPWAGQVAVWSPWAVTFGAVDGLRAELAALRDRRDEALALLGDAERVENAIGAPQLVARTRLRAAQLQAEAREARAERGAELPPGAPPAPAPAAPPNWRPERLGLTAPATSAAPSRAVARLGRPLVPAAPLAPPPVVEDGAVIQCFGRFALQVDGRAIDHASLTPRLRTLLWFLAVHADRAVHAEHAIDALWPEADTTAGRRNLQVALSALRQALEPGVKRTAWRTIAREGDGYRLLLGEGRSDLLDFERAAADAKRTGDAEHAAAALAAYGGDLIPEAGPLTWLVERRDTCRRAAADTALLLAQARLGDGDAAGAMEACERGLAIDRYVDGLWRTLVAAAEANGDRAVAARAQRDYDAVLADLGL